MLAAEGYERFSVMLLCKWVDINSTMACKNYLGRGTFFISTALGFMISIRTVDARHCALSAHWMRSVCMEQPPNQGVSEWGRHEEIFEFLGVHACQTRHCRT